MSCLVAIVGDGSMVACEFVILSIVDDSVFVVDGISSGLGG